jgi:hypothetical protein
MNKKLNYFQNYFAERWSDSVSILERTLEKHNTIVRFNGQVIIEGHKVEQKQFIRINVFLIMLVCIMVVLMTNTAYANHNASRQYFIRGVAATGINDLCGSPLFSLNVSENLLPTFHATVLGEYDPDGEVPIPLSPTNCNDDIIVATSTDLDFLARVGLPDVDIRLKNIPLRDVPVISSPDGSRSVIPTLGSVPGNALPPTKSNPNDTITLGDWLDARGWMYIRCKADGSAMVKLRFKNLIPNGVYSLWGLWNTTPPGALQARIIPVPLGGIPNVMIPDRRGVASFSRELASCPKDVTADGSIMLFVDLAYHSDSNLAGAFPQIGGTPTKFKTAEGTEFSSRLVPGAVAHDHVLFLISGEKL